MSQRVLITGAAGFIGGRLARALGDDGFELDEGDILRPETLRGAGRGIDAAYYLIHLTGRRGPEEFESRERSAVSVTARTLATCAGATRRRSSCTSMAHH